MAAPKGNTFGSKSKGPRPKTSIALRGNKNSVGHGRKPNPGQSNEELIQLGEDLLEWMKQEDANPKSNIVHLSEFYSEIKGLAPSQWNSIRQRDCFLHYYEKAIIWMGKRLLKNKDLSPSYGNRFIGIYFKEVRDHDREVVEHKIDYEIEKKGKKTVGEMTAEELFATIREVEGEPRVQSNKRSMVETQSPILDQRRSGQQDQILSQLGSERSLERSPSLQDSSESSSVRNNDVFLPPFP